MPRQRWALWISVVVFPPLGLILLWMRRDWRLLGKLAGTLALAAIAMVELVYIYGMRVDLGGQMQLMGIRFANESRNAAKVEESRAKQRQEPPPVLEPADVPVTDHRQDAKPALSVKPVPTSYWTDFRGPNRDGVYSEAPILTDWPSAGLPLAWKQPIGGGYASFTAGEGRAYTIEQRRDKEAVTAYDIETGRELWAFLYPAQFEEILGGPGPRATPVYHDGLVYSLGANGDLYCLSAKTGKPKWSKNILTDNGTANVHWAMAGSPLILDDTVVVTPGGTGGKSIVAYDRLTGRPVWRSLNDRAGYTSPIVATLAGRRQIVWISGERVVGVATEDGKLLWEYPFPAQMDMNCAQPVVIDGSNVMVSSASGPGAALLEISEKDGAFAARQVWKNNRMKNKFNSSVLYQGYIYGLDESILACIDPKTGELKWKGGRYGYGQVLLAASNQDGYLIVLTETGDVVLVRATPEGHQELARFSAIEGKTWNIPAIDHGRLLVRNATEMACFRLGRTKE